MAQKTVLISVTLVFTSMTPPNIEELHLIHTGIIKFILYLMVLLVICGGATGTATVSKINITLSKFRHTLHLCFPPPSFCPKVNFLVEAETKT